MVHSGPKPKVRRKPRRDDALTLVDNLALEIARRSGIRESPNDARRKQQRLTPLRVRLVPMTRVPYIARKLTDPGVIADPTTGYLLGFVDGQTTLGAIVQAAGLPEREALEILVRAFDQGHIAFR